MTEEIIKQRAEDYANSMYDKKYQSELWKECYMIHIAGAHSRDEEIKELKKALSSVQKGMAEHAELYNKKGN